MKPPLFFAEGASKQKCLWSLNQTFALWSSTTAMMQQTLVENGLMIGVMLELQAFRNVPTSEVIYNCSTTCFQLYVQWSQKNYFSYENHHACNNPRCARIKFPFHVNFVQLGVKRTAVETLYEHAPVRYL